MGKRSRTKRLKRNQDTNIKPRTINNITKAKTPWPFLSLLSPTNKFWIGVALFVGIVSFYYAFSPKLSIHIGNTVDALNPFATQFILKNDSLLRVNIVDPYQCIMNKVSGERVKINGAKFIKDVPPIPFLEPNESTTFLLPFPNIKFVPPTPRDIYYVDVEIIVSYYPAFFPQVNILKKEYRTRFITTKNKDGNLQWVHEAKSIKIAQP